jgi:hypothetical protein
MWRSVRESFKLKMKLSPGQTVCARARVRHEKRRSVVAEVVALAQSYWKRKRLHHSRNGASRNRLTLKN